MPSSTGRVTSLVHLHILVALAEGDRHGWGIRQDVERDTDGRISLGPGTLYEAIQRLEQIGLIEESPRRTAEGERHRRYYRLTRDGWGALEGEVGQLRRLLDRALASPRLRKAASA
jgi:DNA-binding PadR family transcriptional regulator